jgi:uncharacterized membrane protein
MKKSKSTQVIYAHLARYVRSYNFLGIFTGVVLFSLSLLPSLLPRPWLMQGIVSGASFAIGYGLGVIASKSTRWLVQKELPKNIKASAWKILWLAPLLMLLFIILGHSWQNDVRALLGQQPANSVHILNIAIVSVLLFHILLYIGRGIRLLNHKLSRLFASRLPSRVGVVLGIGATLLIIVWILNGFLFQSFIDVSNNIYAKANNQTREGTTIPASPLRSGSSESFVPWQTLGSRGQDFVARGPSQQRLQAFSGQQPVEPIRVYVGVNTAPTARERAVVAAKELVRTKAYEREVLVLATATGSGWLEPQSMDSIEYMYNGNTAIVSQQYSYLPSWISFLADSQNAQDAGRELYDAVYNEWIKLPTENRPKLIAYGLSLGSFGGQSVYSSAQDVRRSVDGALFVGTPSTTSLWKNITDIRRKGSPEVLPVYENGEEVRFASNKADIVSTTTDWKSPSKLLYLQHASDPVIWWNTDLILKQPDWLKEQRGSDVSSMTRWIPFVTFMHASVDQFYGVTVPNGYGHNYSDVMVSAWAVVTSPEDWTVQKTEKLQKIIDSYDNE